MAFKTDCGGIAMRADIKLSNAATTWNTRLSQIGRVSGDITLVTFSLCDLEYIRKILSKRGSGRGVTVVCNSKYNGNAYRVKREFPDMKVYVNPNAHAKLALIEPGTVWLSSENLGHKKDTYDASIGIHSIEAYKHFQSQVDSLISSRETIEI